MTNDETPMTDSGTRAAYTSGLRKLADLLDANPLIDLPYSGKGDEMLWIPSYSDSREQLSLIARTIPGRKDKAFRGDAFDLFCSLDGLRLRVIGTRSSVCERVVTGTRTEVVRELKPGIVTPPHPDEDYIEREVTHEIVEWVCDEPVLA